MMIQSGSTPWCSIFGAPPPPPPPPHMALGFFAGGSANVDNHHVAELNALVMDFALPAALSLRPRPRRGRCSRSSASYVVSPCLDAALRVVLLDAAPPVRVGSGEAAVQALTIALPNYAAAGSS